MSNLALITVAASLFIAAPPTGRHEYSIVREGTRIGAHAVTFERQKAHLVVRHEIRIKVDVVDLFTAYRYDLDSREIWDGRRLKRLDAKTDRNGSKLRVQAKLTPRGFFVRSSRSGLSNAPTALIPASPAWNVLSTGPAKMMDAESGALLDVTIGAPERVSIRVGKTNVRCARYDVRGDLTASLWYAEEGGLLIKKALEAPDGSNVVELLERED